MSELRLSIGMYGDEVNALHEQLRRHGFDLPEDETARGFFGPATRAAVREWQRGHGLSPTGKADARTRAELEPKVVPRGRSARGGSSAEPRAETATPGGAPRARDASTASSRTARARARGATTRDPMPKRRDGGRTDRPRPAHSARDSRARRVEGHLLFDDGQPAAGVMLRVYSRAFGGADRPIGEVRTDAEGGYAVSYDTGESPVHLEVRLVDSAGTEISLSTPKFNAEAAEELNLVAPASALPVGAEYERLATDLDRNVGDAGDLATTREDDERQDLTVLHHATGWDARLIALAATAAKLSSETGIPKPALYALFRAGLPTDKQQLTGMSPKEVEGALKAANAAGIVDLNDEQIAGVKVQFERFTREFFRSQKTPGTHSSFNALLESAPLGADHRSTFEQVLVSHRGPPADLWRKAEQQGITREEIAALKLQGKLAYLTLNQAALGQKLQAEIGSPDNLGRLVDEGLYDSDAWKRRLREVAGEDEEALKRAIPPVYTGESTADRLDAYAADLARKVRRSFPTRVIGRMVEKGDVPLGAGHDAASVAAVIQKADALGFRLGRDPVNGFVKKNHERLFGPNASDEEVAAATKSVKKLACVYQMTPSTKAFVKLLELGVDSADDIAGLPPEVFRERFGHEFRSSEEAELVYRKAQQISAVTRSVVGTASQLASAPPVYAMSPPVGRREEITERLSRAFPGLERLFGSLDYCDCEHCRSVLSPAAYLVDLLQFLDPEQLDWDSFLRAWEDRHGEPFTAKYKKPYDALIERRPDLPHLPLTCENTLRALPYIDVVNEILEYYVAHGALGADAARDTGAATTPELLAEPQYVTPLAYRRLRQADYPLVLPFDIWLETVRRFLDYFETPLWQLLDRFRSTDELFRSSSSSSTSGAPTPRYYRSSVFAEYLGLSPREHRIFTRSNPLAKWFELYGYDQESAASELRSAKTLARRLGVTYTELADVVRTSFVSPGLRDLSILWKLRVDVDDAVRYFNDREKPEAAAETKAFEDRLETLDEDYGPGLDAKAELERLWSEGAFAQTLLLRSESALNTFDDTYLEFGDGGDVDSLALLRINLFVRLWKKLGWTIEETDRALDVFIPRSARPLTGTNLSPALATALLYIAHLRTLEAQLQVGAQGRAKLLTIWSDIPTIGKSSLYAQLFLTPGVLERDPVFDDALGRYLEDPNVRLREHLSTVQGALGLMADDVTRILADAGRSLERARLNLGNVSLLYRHALLAKALKLSVRDLLALKTLSGTDPFKPLHGGPVRELAQDHPLEHTLRFVEIARTVSESGFNVEDLGYLLRHLFDPVGKYRSDADGSLALVRSLAAELRRIQAEHTVEAVEAGGEERLLQELSLVLPPDAVETFHRMWAGTVQYRVEEEPVPDNAKLDPSDFEHEPAIEVSYDDDADIQQLTFRGVLLEAKREEIENANPSPVLHRLLEKVRGQVQAFYEDYLARFMTENEFGELFPPLPANATEAERKAALGGVLRKVAKVALPFVGRQLSRQLVVQTLASRLGADPAFADALLTDPALLSDPSATDESLFDAFLAAGDRGATVTYFASDDATGWPLEVRTLPDAATSVPDDETPPRPAAARSSRIEGYFEVPTAGVYRFFVDFDRKDAEAELWIDQRPEPIVRGQAAADGASINDVAELKATAPYRFLLIVRKLGGGDARLSVRADNLPKGTLARFPLYPQASVDRVLRADTQLAKALKIITALALSERDLRHIRSHAADFDGLDLSALPTHQAGESSAEAEEALEKARVLFRQFLRLAGYARLKRDLAAGTDDLVAIFENARRTRPASVSEEDARTELLADLYRRVAELTRRDVATVRAVAEELRFAARSSAAGGDIRVWAPDFAQEKGIVRLWDALQLVERLGVAAADVIRWATPAPDERVASDLRSTVKARFESDAWQRVAKSIFDGLRQRKRDALVAYIMHRQGFERAEQLFEHFLIDPGMEPVVQTSRLRLAISSVQLFIQRCLLNLEPEVHPSTINSKQWQSRKRYSVWAGSLQLFLFPENWLEPEFRDDKSHLFQELEGALLQGDVTNDLAEDAFFQYLRKLEELARLDLVAMYVEERPLDPASNVLHVIGRTFSLPHKYFYRRYAHHAWTPWDPVPAEIEGDHVAAVVWRDRLHVFWVTFLEKGAQKETTGRMTIKDVAEEAVDDVVAKEVEVQLNWIEYAQGEWTTRESSGFGDPMRVKVTPDFAARHVFIHVSKEYEGGEERAVRISLDFDRVRIIHRRRGGLRHPEIFGSVGFDLFNGPIVSEERVEPSSKAFRVVSRNSPPQITEGGAAKAPPYSAPADRVTRYAGAGPLRVTYVERIETADGQPPVEQSATKDILAQADGYSLLVNGSPLAGVSPDVAALVAPFFYQDGARTFYVEPALTELALDEWEEWAVTTPSAREVVTGDERNVAPLVAAVPQSRAEWLTGALEGKVPVIDPRSRFVLQPRTDWLTDPTTTVRFGERSVGRSGGLDGSGLAPR
jgi:hypothetical protein